MRNEYNNQGQQSTITTQPRHQTVSTGHRDSTSERAKQPMGANLSMGNFQPIDGENQGQDGDQNNQTNQNKDIQDMGGITTQNSKNKIHCLTIIGQIEGHYTLPAQNKTTKYEHIIPQLVAIEEDKDIKGLLILLNTVGGDVEAGLAIAELISGMRKPTVSLVLGGGHSIGVPLAVSAKKSFIAETATMTIHPVRMNGLVLGVPQTLHYFNKMQDRITNFVEQNSNIDRDTFTKLMMNTEELVTDVGTMLTGEEAVECGLIDSVGNLSDALQCLYDMVDETDSEYDDNHKDKEKDKEKCCDDNDSKKGCCSDSHKSDSHGCCCGK